MPLLKYEDKQFRSESLIIIARSNAIIEEYRDEGYDLTLRQLYYQFVARGYIPNKDSEYKRLGSVINDARLAGMIDWESIIDRTRYLRKNSHWDSPSEIVDACAEQFRLDTRSTQVNYIEVWIEKDALIGVVEGICRNLDVACFSCRGYVSQSAMWRAAYERLITAEENGQETWILHLGDHDPSGIDMTRDIQDRLNLFESDVNVSRIALTMEQIKELNPPPNPAKLTDSRCQAYVEEYGDESWELDALDPRYLSNLIEQEVNALTDGRKRKNLVKKQSEGRSQLRYIIEQWEQIFKNRKV